MATIPVDVCDRCGYLTISGRCPVCHTETEILKGELAQATNTLDRLKQKTKTQIFVRQVVFNGDIRIGESN